MGSTNHGVVEGEGRLDNTMERQKSEGVHLGDWPVHEHQPHGKCWAQVMECPDHSLHYSNQ